MQTKTFGPTQRQVVTIGQGTWQMERNDRQRCIQALQRGIELGLTHIDTAELYGAGKVEEMLSEVISGKREQLFLASKVKPQNASRQGTIAACEASLKRLKTDRLDLYMLHWVGPHPLTETIAAFEALQQQGKILSYGVSNFDVSDLQEAIRIAGPGKIACNQVLYHLEERGIERGVLPFCAQNQIAVVAYSPFFVGRFPPKGKGGEVLLEIAKKHNASPHQVALRFLLRDPAVFVIPKMSSAPHVEDNAKADGLVLTEEEIVQLEKAFPIGPDRGLATI